MEKPRLGIDARLFGIKDRGIGRYTESIINSLVSNNDFSVVLFVRPNSAALEYAEQKKIEHVKTSARPYSWTEQLSFVRQLYQAKCDIIHFPHFNVPLLYFGPTVVTVHDLILHHFNNRSASLSKWPIYILKYFIFRINFLITLYKVKFIVAVSDYTKEDLLDLFWLDKNKVKVVKEIVNFTSAHDYEESDKIWYNKYGDYVLHVGATYPHKNLNKLIRAWVKIGHKTNKKLVFVAPSDQFTKRLEKLSEDLGILNQEKGGIFFLPPQSDEALKRLYEQSGNVIVPSLYEGVGLPGLEALQLGANLISSAESVLCETYGEAATYIPVTKIVHLENGILRAINNKLTNSPSYEIESSESQKNKLVQIYSAAIK